MKTKRTIRILAAMMLAILAVTSLASCNDPAGSTGYDGVFDPLYSDLTRYVALSGSDYKGIKIDYSEQYASLEKPHDMAWLEARYETVLEELQYANRTGDGTVKTKSKPIGYGDDVYLYVLGATYEDTDGTVKPVVNTGEYFDNAYTASPLGPFTVGKAQVFGKAFDDALVGLVPKDTYLIRETMDAITETDVLCMTYSYGTKTGKQTSFTQDRVVLSEQNPAFVSALIAKFEELGRPYGEKITFDATVTEKDKDGNDVVKEYTYNCTVHYVVKEQYQEVTFTIPKDFFSDADEEKFGKGLKVLHGKKVTVRVIVPYMVDYELPDTNTVEFFKDVLKLETEETEYDKVVEAYKKHSLETMNKQIQDNLDAIPGRLLWNKLLSNLQGTSQTGSAFIAYPDSYMQEKYNYIYQTMYNQYLAYGTGYGSVDAYIYYAVDSNYTSFASYVESATYGEAQKDLVAYTIYRREGLRVTEAEIDAEYKEYMDSLIKAANDSKAEDDETVYDQAYFEEEYGKDVIRNSVEADLIMEKVTAYLVKVNNVILVKV